MSDNENEAQNLWARGLIAAAENVLATAWGDPVHLGDGKVLRERGRNRVLRCSVREAPPGAPDSVIIKASVGDADEVFNPADDTFGGTPWRFYNEWAATGLLGHLDTAPSFGARLYGADRATGLIVTEDLGDGDCLADRMRGTDRAKLESALFAYALSLGRLHAATAGRAAEFEERRLVCGATERDREPEGTRWLRENVLPFRTQCEALGMTLPEGIDTDIEAVRRALDEPGPFLAFTPGDTCPDNHRLTGESAVRFFDFEFGGFRHALLDAAYLSMPFPTCWYVNRLPADLVERLENAYRAELVQSVPEAGDDSRFFPALAAACAYWAIASVSWSLEPALKEDGLWGLSTHRQRHPLRLANLAALTERVGVLPALRETARSLEAKLRAAWSDMEEMPLYAPFRS